MRLLGVDYGRAKIGLARAEGGLAEPWKVVQVNSWQDAIRKIGTEIEKEKPDTVVVGVSEGSMGEEQKKFAESLALTLSLPVKTWDEGLSTQDAQLLAIQSGRGPKKRHELEDAYAAAVMLQSYLDGTESPEGI
ncbi:MAG: putative holliday junction resolvase [Microgenomates group bacterium Gr01-1014_5]|nr:MAG: putative holliday junction resolvase [Microgenomates group bacterium Gr01-1014_5]